MQDNNAMRPVGQPKPVPAGAIGQPGWSWGWTDSGEWLTIAGSAHRRPQLGAAIGDAYRYGPDTMDTLALVVAVPHGGVTVTGTAYRILQLAEPIPDAGVRPQYDQNDRCLGCGADTGDPHEQDPRCPFDTSADDEEHPHDQGDYSDVQ